MAALSAVQLEFTEQTAAPQLANAATGNTAAVSTAINLQMVIS
jgi:hypothetical protein